MPFEDKTLFIHTKFKKARRIDPIDIPLVLEYTTFKKSTAILSVPLPRGRARTGSRLFTFSNLADTVRRFFISVKRRHKRDFIVFPVKILEIRSVRIEAIFADVIFVYAADVLRIMGELPRENDLVDVRRRRFFQAVRLVGELRFLMRFQVGGLVVRQFISRAFRQPHKPAVHCRQHNVVALANLAVDVVLQLYTPLFRVVTLQNLTVRLNIRSPVIQRLDFESCLTTLCGGIFAASRRPLRMPAAACLPLFAPAALPCLSAFPQSRGSRRAVFKQRAVFAVPADKGRMHESKSDLWDAGLVAAHKGNGIGLLRMFR